MSKRSILLYVLLGLAVTATLINSRILISPTLISLFLFALVAAFTALNSGVTVLKNRKIYNVNFSWPELFLIMWAAYVIFYPLFTGKRNGNLKDSYLLTCIIFYFSLVTILPLIRIKLIRIYQIIFLAGIFEALICILQGMGIIKSMNTYFNVTGTNVNPNTIAMFLVLSFSSGIALLGVVPKSLETSKSPRSKKTDRLNGLKDSTRGKKTRSLIVLTGLVLIIVAIVLLKCRTAILGVLAVLIVIWGSRFRPSGRINVRKQLRLVITILGLILLVPLLLFLFNAKEDSSRGRLLVWKVSTQMILEKPWTGYGYGLFERNFNLAQAKYFNSGRATEEEIERADHITLAYNEVIESTVEGGIIGTMLLWGFIGLLIHKGLRQIRNIHDSTSTFAKSPEMGIAVVNQTSLQIPAIAGIIAFTVMSLVNFTVQAVPVMSVFIIYSSLLSAPLTTISQDKPLTDKTRFLKEKKQLSNVQHSHQNQIVALILVVSVFAIELPFIKTGFAHYHLARSVQTISTGNQANLERTIERMKELRPELSSSEGYYRYSALALYRLNDLESAINYYTEASELTSNPDLFLSRGVCYEKLGRYSAAEADYLMASNIVPNRIIPKYRLMLLYLQKSNPKEALAMAKQIVEMQPKVNNSQAESAKKAAQEVLRKLNSRNNTLPFNAMQ